MGEAKRRKKLMGEDYGKKRQRIVRGTEELETHLGQLKNAWSKKRSEVLGNPPNLDIPLSEFQAKKNHCQQWLDDYLEIYSRETQKQLAEEFINIVYQSFANHYEKIAAQKKNLESMLEVVASTVPLMLQYSFYKDYLDNEIRELCDQTIEAINQKAWKEMLQESKEIEEAGKEHLSQIIKYLIQDCLEPSENFPDSSQGTPEEITLTNQHETIFYE